MTTTFLDSTNVTRQETIDFTTTQDVIAISVKIGSGLIVEERCYRDGVFLYPYLASTTDGTTWALRRTGGWPQDFRVYVDEAEGGPTGGQPWGTVYDVDLTAQGSQSSPTEGTHTIDGLTWYAYGDLTGLPFGASMGRSLVSGSGLRLAMLSNHGTTNTGNITLNYPHWVLPLANVPGFNPSAPVIVRGRFNTATGASNHQALIGLCETTNGTRLQAGDRAKDLWAGRNSGSFFSKRGSADANTMNIDIGGVMGGYSTTLCGVHQLLDRYGMPGAQFNAGSDPAADALLYDSTFTALKTVARVNPCVIFSMQCNSGALFELFLTRLIISQPRVAA